MFCSNPTEYDNIMMFSREVQLFCFGTNSTTVELTNGCVKWICAAEHGWLDYTTHSIFLCWTIQTDCEVYNCCCLILYINFCIITICCIACKYPCKYSSSTNLRLSDISLVDFFLYYFSTVLDGHHSKR